MTHPSPGVLLAAARVSGEVVPARAQMATTLGFHIILACLGVALPSVVLLAEFIGLRRGDETALRLARRWSQASGVPIAVSGIFGAMSVIAVNSWMNQPGGFTQRGGKIVSVNPWQVYFNRAAIYQMPHMILAAYMVTGFLVAGVYAAGILRGRRDRYHYTGFAVGFVPAAVLTPFQIFVGDTAARAIAQGQPVKFASMEYVPHTSRHVPEWLGGVYVNGRVYGGVKIPYLDSVLAGFGPGTKVIGWDSVPPAFRPPVVWLIHLSFDVMVVLAFLLLLAGLCALYEWWRHRRLPPQRLFWWAGAASGVAAIVAMECGWVVTEVGRQPWVVYRLQTTAAAATTNGGVITTLSVIIVVYAVLGTATILILRMLARSWRRGDLEEAAVPYGPNPAPQDLAAGEVGR